MAEKTFWLAPLGVAQLSDLVLEGTSFLIKKQGPASPSSGSSEPEASLQSRVEETGRTLSN